jgi:hypothetical protein
MSAEASPPKGEDEAARGRKRYARRSTVLGDAICFVFAVSFVWHYVIVVAHAVDRVTTAINKAIQKLNITHMLVNNAGGAAAASTQGGAPDRSLSAAGASTPGATAAASKALADDMDEGELWAIQVTDDSEEDPLRRRRVRARASYEPPNFRVLLVWAAVFVGGGCVRSHVGAMVRVRVARELAHAF